MQELSLDKLSPFPLVQLAAAILVLGAFAVTVYRGARKIHISRW
jgi:hypothetical protein